MGIIFRNLPSGTSFSIFVFMPSESPNARAKTRVGIAALEVQIDFEVEINPDLIERRKSLRPIPVPEAIERNDEESWSTWSELTAQQVREAASKSAVAKLRQLLRRMSSGQEES
jgi:hypothetical protein